MLAGAHGGDALFGVERGGRGEHDGIDVVDRQHVGQLGGGVFDAVVGGERLRPVEFAPDDGDHLHAVDVPHGVDVLGAERAGAGECDRDGHAPSPG